MIWHQSSVRLSENWVVSLALSCSVHWDSALWLVSGLLAQQTSSRRYRLTSAAVMRIGWGKHGAYLNTRLLTCTTERSFGRSHRSMSTLFLRTVGGLIDALGQPNSLFSGLVRNW